MKIYTQEDLANFERDEYGRLICPSGDYTQIKSFGDRCSFGEDCIFCEGCSFGELCSFGVGCNFGKSCNFGKWCSFSKLCKFGKWCSFGEDCNLENNLYFEDIEDPIERVLKIDRIGSFRGCTYFFKTKNQIYVRCGCFFGNITEFEREINETHENAEQYRTEYLKAIEFVKAVI